MKKDLKQKWITALRSGEYKQTKNTLVSFAYPDDSPSYCCLGVLCEIAGLPKDGNKPAYINPLASEETVIYGLHKMYTSIQDPLLKEWGLTYEQQEWAMEMNDTQSKSFEQIADWIEGNL